MIKTIAVGIFCSLVMLSPSCSKSSGGDKNKANQPDTQNGGFSLTYKDRFAELVDDVQKDKDGNIWVGHSAMKDPGAPVTSSIEKRDPNGQLTGAVIELGEVILSGFTVFDNGSVVAAVYVDGESIGAEYALKLIQIEADGKIGIQKKFEDYVLPEPAEFNCRPERTERGFWDTNSARIAKVGESIALLTYYCRYSRISLLDSKLSLIWSKENGVQRNDDWAFYGSERLVVTGEGTIVTAGRINASEVSAFNAYFHESLSGVGESDILLNTYDPNGNRHYSGLVGTENNDFASGVAANGNKIFVAADIQVNRPTSVRNFQRDAWLAAYDVKQKKISWSKAIDIQDEDSVESMAIVDGQFLAIGGSTGWLQVPTMSVVKHGDAFVLLTDFDGNVKGKKIFGTPRNDYVGSIIDLGEGKLLLGGGKDGPITHDGDRDKSQLHRFGFVDIFDLNNLLIL